MQTIKIRQLHYIKEVIKSTLQTIIKSIFPALKHFKYQPIPPSKSSYHDEAETKKHMRKPNWSQDQLLLLAQFVLERRGIIFDFIFDMRYILYL